MNTSTPHKGYAPTSPAADAALYSLRGSRGNAEVVPQP